MTDASHRPHSFLDNSKSMEYPNPKLDSFSIRAVYPYFLDLEGDKLAAYQHWLENPKVNTESDGWTDEAPEAVDKKGLARWFFKELRTLFFDAEEPDEDNRMLPRFRWLKYEPSELKNQTKLARLSIGSRKGDPFHIAIEPIEIRNSKPIEIHALLTHFGIGFIIIRFEAKGLPLASAMQISHWMANSDNPRTPTALVLLPNTKQMPTETDEEKRRFHAEIESLSKKEQDARRYARKIEKYRNNLEKVRVIGTSGLTVRLDDRQSKTICDSLVENALNSLTSLLRDAQPVTQSSTESAKHSFRLATHGRIPIVCQYQFSDDLVLADNISDAIEWTIVKTSPHPYGLLGQLPPGERPKIKPLTCAQVLGDCYERIDITGSQRIHVTSEGMFSIGSTYSSFDRGEWPTRFSREYFLTWLLSLHQAVVCQMLTWRACSTVVNDDRNTNRLVDRFLEFKTDYDFSAVSHHFDLQRLYRSSRRVLGVEDATEHVGTELIAWLENENRKEQESLNSIAVFAVLASLATFFVNLPVNFFNNDNKVGLFSNQLSDAGNAVSTVHPLWFWVPLLSVILWAFKSRALSRHRKRLKELFIDHRR